MLVRRQVWWILVALSRYVALLTALDGCASRPPTHLLTLSMVLRDLGNLVCGVV